VPSSPYLRTQRVLDVLCDQTGIGPYHAYEPLCDMARPWMTHLALIDFHGNYGSPDFGAAGPRYTECRLTALGGGAVAAERHLIGALPIGLINGNTHTGGPQPPLDPQRVMNAIRSASTASNDEIASIIGLPSFPTGCVVVGDIDAFASGSETRLQLAARVTELAADQLLISHLPPHCSASGIASSIQSRLSMASRFPEYASEGASLPAHFANLPPIRDLRDQWSVLEGSRIVVTIERGSNLAHARVFLDDIHGVKTTINAQLPRPERSRKCPVVTCRSD